MNEFVAGWDAVIIRHLRLTMANGFISTIVLFALQDRLLLRNASRIYCSTYGESSHYPVFKIHDVLHAGVKIPCF